MRICRLKFQLLRRRIKSNVFSINYLPYYFQNDFSLQINCVNNRSNQDWVYLYEMQLCRSKNWPSILLIIDLSEAPEIKIHRVSQPLDNIYNEEMLHIPIFLNLTS